MTIPSRFEDHRGVIQDILTEPIDAVTRIFTVAGAVRGNHFHGRTTQWTYVESGRLLVATQGSGYEMHNEPYEEREYGPGDVACDPPGIVHAWKALEDTVTFEFTKGPRSGTNYESDTTRLEVPLL